MISAASQSAALSGSRSEALVLAIVLTLAASAIPSWGVFGSLWQNNIFGVRALPWASLRSLILVALGLLLVLPSRYRSGLRLGEIRAHWKGVLLVCVLPVLVTAVVYPNLPVRPFTGAYHTIWSVSPLGQALVFNGFIFGYLQQYFPEYVHPRVRIQWGLIITTLLFGLWHVPAFFSTAAGYVWFQLFYTGILGIVPALSRQWTGSILYAWLTHTCVNFIAWSSGGA